MYYLTYIANHDKLLLVMMWMATMGAQRKHLQIRQLDERFAALRMLVGQAAPPRGGWLRTVRKSLGISAAQLAARLRVTRQAVVDQERREGEGTITLAVLRRAAEAMDCDLHYAVVPRQPIVDTIRTRARAVAERRLRRIAHSMSLEEQAVPDGEFERQVDDLADQIVRALPRDLWAEPTR
jgi:predicted DNA-binding mobile mystery protein A